MYQFEKLEIWGLSLDIVEECYKLTKDLPRSETFGLKSQIERSAVSTTLNIAEGRGAGTDKEFGRFLKMSLRSLFETVAGFKIAIRLKYLTEEDCKKVFEMCDECGAKTKSLINHLKKQETKDK